MQLYVGTSGWSYDWNADGFDWYMKNSNLNSAELNASFYHFPFLNMISSWNSKRTEASPLEAAYEGFLSSCSVGGDGDDSDGCRISGSGTDLTKTKPFIW